MFTGIVEELGTIKNMLRQGNSMQLTINAKYILSDINLGDSIAVNGICLTVIKFTEATFVVDVMPETFSATSLSSLEIGSKVNLERAMAAKGRFGGHFVTGHVDGVGTIVAKRRQENALLYDIEVPQFGLNFIIDRGSIAVDGTSLTIFNIKNNIITISLIPHTAEATILGTKEIGDIVNIEFDMLAKYVQRTLENQQLTNRSLTMKTLKDSGFV